MKKKKNIVVILDNIRSALNVGAIFRTCDGAGIHHLYLCGITPFPPHPKVLKTALGADQSVSFSKQQNTLKVVQKLQREDYRILALEEGVLDKESVDLFGQDFGDRIAVVFGHEITGVQPQTIEAADFLVHLPMLGTKNSLNVATTVGITIYTLQFGHVPTYN